MVWLNALVGPSEFAGAAVTVAQYADGQEAALIAVFALLVAGFGVKAALFPLHGWLPRAMVAPAPVSALLHAVAVVKAGAFGIVRVVYDVYGIALAHRLKLTEGLSWLAGFTIIYGSVMALRQDNLKLRLAYSTVSQISYIMLGAALFSAGASVGALVHLVHQGLMKITLFMCAGNFAHQLGIHNVSEMNGIGRRMPWSMAAFTVGALGMIGLPPFAGFISKWALGVGAADAGAYWALAVLLASSALNAAYFLPILHRAWLRPPSGEWPKAAASQSWEIAPALLVPPIATAAATLLAGLFAATLISPLGWIENVVATEYAL
jgi:multicomponent Na+:H+ antiporter subunit D